MAFYGGFYGFMTNLIVALFMTCFEKPQTAAELEGLVYWDTPRLARLPRPFYRTPAALAIAAAVLTIVLNVIFW